MKLTAEHTLASPEAAARKLVELAARSAPYMAAAFRARGECQADPAADR